MLEPVEILQEYWGYSAFRTGQEDVIRAVIEGRDVLALFPTGGGKSICYQVPALALDGCCIVISPLIALMKDQTDTLIEKNIPATFLHSGMNRQQIRHELERMVRSELKLIYVAPERLANREFLGYVKNSKVSLIAVDEAHCISQWGFDFRPSYRMIKELRETVPKIPVMALTASATPQVQEDISSQLALKDPLVARRSFSRENLSYKVSFSEDKLGVMIDQINEVDGSVVVYVRNRRLTVQLADLLRDAGVPAEAYHAGMTYEERNRIQYDWMHNKVKVVVSTNAFGMGVDKADVRLVVHYLLPDSLESYYQESGRAGRDGKEAGCLLLFNPDDETQAIQNLNAQHPPPAFSELIYEALGNYLGVAYNAGQGNSYDFDLTDFSKKFEHKPIQIYHALNALEKLGYLKLSDGLRIPSRAKFIISSRELYDFQVRYEKYDQFIKILLRRYAGINTEFVNINEKDIAVQSGGSLGEVQKNLQLLTEQGVMEYVPRSDKPRITFLRARVREITDPENFLAANLDRNQSRLQKMLQYVNAESCRMQFICSYFGENLEEPCGHCDICMLKSKLSRQRIKGETLAELIMQALNEAPFGFEGLSDKIGISPDQLRSELDWLLQEERIAVDDDGRFSCR